MKTVQSCLSAAATWTEEEVEKERHPCGRMKSFSDDKSIKWQFLSEEEIKKRRSWCQEMKRKQFASMMILRGQEFRIAFDDFTISLHLAQEASIPRRGQSRMCTEAKNRKGKKKTRRA